MPTHVQTKTEIRETLDRYGVRPRKRHGQHFLIDGNLMRRLAEAAELSSDDVVLEVGAGTGGLTDLLVGTAGRVIAVEIDPALQVILRERFAGRENFQLIAGDALAGKHHLSPEVVSALHVAKGGAGRLKLVANLPYNIATPLLANLLTGETPPSLLVFTVQKEVADRFLAAPRSKDYGPLSVLFQVAGDVRQIATVPASAFWPAPEVASSMIRCVPRDWPPDTGVTLRELMTVVHAGFAYRRKTLRYNLRKVLSEDQMQGAETAFGLDRRAEELSIPEWIALSARVLKPHSRIRNPKSEIKRR